MRSPIASIIMPAYNVEDRVAGAVEMAEQAVAGVTEGYEVIVVNDGSKDGTRKALEGLRSSRIKAVDRKANMGRGPRGRSALTIVELEGGSSACPTC
jgi:glycosyltransferase involved in cell wall biosynthesis